MPHLRGLTPEKEEKEEEPGGAKATTPAPQTLTPIAHTGAERRRGGGKSLKCRPGLLAAVAGESICKQVSVAFYPRPTPAGVPSSLWGRVLWGKRKTFSYLPHNPRVAAAEILSSCSS